MKKDFLAPIFVLLAICVVVTAALAATNYVTAPIISAAAEQRAGGAMVELIPTATSFAPIEISDKMAELGIKELYDAMEGDTQLGYIVVSASAGYKGADSIILMVAVDLDLSIINLRTLQNNETTGLGTRVSEPEFESTFIGSNASFADYEAISGATISSKAYFAAADHALQACAEVTSSRGGFVS